MWKTIRTAFLRELLAVKMARIGRLNHQIEVLREKLVAQGAAEAPLIAGDVAYFKNSKGRTLYAGKVFRCISVEGFATCTPMPYKGRQNTLYTTKSGWNLTLESISDNAPIRGKKAGKPKPFRIDSLSGVNVVKETLSPFEADSRGLRMPSYALAIRGRSEYVVEIFRITLPETE